MLNTAIDYTSQHIQLNPRLSSHPHRHHHISRLSTPSTQIRKLHSSHSLSSVPTLSSFNHTDSDSPLFDSPNALQSSIFSPSISSSFSFSSSSSSSFSTESREEFDPKLRYLEIVDPSPAFPPTYDSVNPSRHITFPIYEQSQTPCSNEDLPAYTPSIESIALVSMKQECEFVEVPRKSRTSDNSHSIKRDLDGHWRNYIMELNSTQLNFYSIDKSLMQDLEKDEHGSPMVVSDPPSPTLSPSSNPHSHSHSSSSLLKFFQTALRRDRRKSVSSGTPCPTCYSFKPVDNERILPIVTSDKRRYLSDVNLVKSYSLQYAKFGLPIGYLIRRNCKITEVNILRLCCESEQFLVKFTDVDTLIEWATSLSVGISISLDLDCRVAPEYRLYPRRIRRRSTSTSTGSENGGVITSASRSRSRSRSGSGSRFSHPVRPSYTSRSHTSPNVPTWRPRSRSYSHQHNAMSGLTPLTPRDEPESFLDGSSDTDSDDEESYEENHGESNRYIDDDDDDRGTDSAAMQEVGLGISGSFENNEVSTRENRAVYDDDVDIDSLLDDFNTFEQHNNGGNKGKTTQEVVKRWNPPPPKIPRKSYLSQTLRCLPLFHGTAKWMGEFFTRSALVAPKFQTNNEPIYYIDGVGDVGTAGSPNGNGNGNGNGSAGSRRNSRSDSGKGVNGRQFPVKNHYLDTFVMSSVGLVKIGSPLML